MKKTFSATIGFLFFISVFQTTLASFSDIPPDHPYYNDINYVQDLGLAQGDVFHPDERIAREVFAKWVLKNAGFSDENYRPRNRRRFQDAPLRNNEYAPYIYKLLDLGVVDFEDGRTFRPDAPITRTEALRWIFEVEGITIPLIFDENQFQAEDVNPNSTAAPVIDKAIRLGLLSSARVYPNRKLTRGLAAHFLKTVKNSEAVLTVTILPSVDSDLMRSQKFDMMADVWNRLFETYLSRSSLNRDRLIYGAIEGMVEEVGDRYTEFDRPGSSTIIESLSGELEGIGAVLQMENDEPVIVTPLAGSPAERAGLQGNDIIIAVDDVPTRGMRFNEIINRIKGRRGTRVKLTIRRDASTLNFDVERDTIRIVSVEGSRTSDNIAVIKINNFGENSLQEFQNIISGFQTNRPRGIIIDLRNNPGGFLNTVVQMAGYFVRNEDEVVEIRYSNRQEQMNSSGNADLGGYRIAVIVNSGTASASEILAGALQDYDLATIIGEPTYGKGSVQELSIFPDGSTLKVTVAEWLTPNNRLINENGINPDIIVPLTNEDRVAGRDPQMDRALAEIRR